MVKRHWCESSDTNSGTRHMYFVELGFEAVDGASAAYLVSAEVKVSQLTYEGVEQEGQRELEVAYAASDVRAFGVVADLEQDARSTIGQPCVCFGVVALGVLGLVAGALVATTNCFMGFVPFAALLCAAVLSGPIFCRPQCRLPLCSGFRVNNLTVTPCAP